MTVGETEVQRMEEIHVSYSLRRWSRVFSVKYLLPQFSLRLEASEGLPAASSQPKDLGRLLRIWNQGSWGQL